MQQAPGDFTKAKIFHWLHFSVMPYVTGHILESEKAPLESRIYYNYPGQQIGEPGGVPVIETGITNNSPSKIARIMDDGTTQLYQYEYCNVFSFGNLTKAVDPVGRTTIYNYDTNGIDLLQVGQLVGSNTNVLSSFITYTNHLPLTVTDASGQTSYFGYNNHGQPTAITNALGQTNTMSYDTNGYLTNVVSSVPGATTSYTYDTTGQVHTVTDSAGYTTIFAYDAADRISKITAS